MLSLILFILGSSYSSSAWVVVKRGYEERSIWTTWTSKSSHETNSIKIIQPSTEDDFTQLSKLIVNTFDDPSSTLFQDQMMNDYHKQTWTDQERIETELHTFQEYTNNVQRLRGYKYALWAAKEFDDLDTSRSLQGKVVGVVEVGFTKSETGSKRPTIGILCVDAEYQALGVGSALIETCESLVSQIWRDTSVYVQVEPWNVRALRFFHKRGYRLLVPSSNHLKNETISEPLVTPYFDSIDPSSWIMVRLYRNRILQDIPHVLMVKQL